MEARRAKVADLLLKRKSYREIADICGVTKDTIVKDVKAIRMEWAETHMDLGEQLTQSIRDLDTLIDQMREIIDAGNTDTQMAATDRLIKLQDQRNRLLNLYPKPGGDTDVIPTGPIELRIEVIQPGNQNLIIERDE